MPVTAFSASFPILGTPGGRPDERIESIPEFKINCNDNQVNVKISRGEKYVTGEISPVQISDQLYSWLQSSPPHFDYWPASVEAELEGLRAMLEDACRTVVETIKYFLFRPDIPDRLLGGLAEFTWEGEACAQHQIPIPPLAYMTAHSSAPLVQANVDALQTGFDSGFRPLVGMRHLFRAIQEDEPRFQWIDTTIALELAIKETLIRKCPEIETLLLEMPSPPLDKLYGSIMKEYLGVASPYRTRIKEAAAIRNKLVHRPYGTVISKENASSYVLIAHKAIAHLFALLYPEWPIAHKMEHTGPLG